jgi:hypothetical protein
VKRSRDQSREEPKRRSWLKIFPPYASWAGEKKSAASDGFPTREERRVSERRGAEQREATSGLYLRG